VSLVAGDGAIMGGIGSEQLRDENLAAWAFVLMTFAESLPDDQVPARARAVSATPVCLHRLRPNDCSK
jgi:hypothetical protein